MLTKPKLKEATKTIYVNDFLSKETHNVFNHAKTKKFLRRKTRFLCRN